MKTFDVGDFDWVFHSKVTGKIVSGYDVNIWFLGAATGSPYIVFISTSGMLLLSDRYIYI